MELAYIVGGKGEQKRHIGFRNKVAITVVALATIIYNY